MMILLLLMTMNTLLPSQEKPVKLFIDRRMLLLSIPDYPNLPCPGRTYENMEGDPKPASSALTGQVRLFVSQRREDDERGRMTVDDEASNL